MISLSDLIKESRKIEIKAKGLVDDNLNGEYKTAFKGRGIDFHDLREYSHGDEVRTIDWNTTARTGEPYVKQFVEQRELTIYIAIDISKSNNYGSVIKSRHHLAALISAILSRSATKNGDRVGFVLFGDKIEQYSEPQKGLPNSMKMLRNLLKSDCMASTSRPDLALEFIMKRQKKRSMIFLISDFLCPQFENSLKVCSFKNEMISIQIIDPTEIELPNVGKVYLSNPENNKTYLVDTSNKNFRKNFKKTRDLWQTKLDKLFKSSNVDHIKLVNDADCDPAKTLKALFKSRASSKA